MACVVVAVRDTDAPRDAVAFCDAVRTGVVVRVIVAPRVTAVRDGADITECWDVVARGNTVAPVRADTDCDVVVAVRVVSRVTTLPSRLPDDCVRPLVPPDVGVTVVAREIPDEEFDCVDVTFDCVRDTVVVAARRVAARATSAESSAYAPYMHNPSTPRKHKKIRLIPVIPLLYM